MISSDMEQRRMAAKSNPIERKITYKNITIPYTLIKSARTSYAISISVDKGPKGKRCVGIPSSPVIPLAVLPTETVLQSRNSAA